MVNWQRLINALGTTETSQEFAKLTSLIDEKAVIDNTPEEYNDPIGRTKYYAYINSGLCIGFRQNVLNFVHFYFDGSENYLPYKGKLLFGINSTWNEKQVIQSLGEPSRRGNEHMDSLLGYLNRWIKYELDGYSLHLQFDQRNQVCRATLMPMTPTHYSSSF